MKKLTKDQHINTIRSMLAQIGIHSQEEADDQELICTVFSPPGPLLLPAGAERPLLVFLDDETFEMYTEAYNAGKVFLEE